MKAARAVALGQSPAQKKQLAKAAGAENATVAEFAERFFRDIQQRDRKDTKMPRRYLDKDILPHIGTKRVNEITVEDLRYVVWRKKDQGFDAAAGQVRGLLKRMLDYAVTCGLLPHNPVSALPMRHVYRAAARDRALTPDEIQLFLRSAQASNIRRQFKIALQLILMTLVRKSELMLAQWKDVHLEEAEWHIPEENSKTGKPHIVYLSRQAVLLFKELKVLASTSARVLPGRGKLSKPFAHNAINSALKTALQDQEIPAFTIHDLRRTASTLLHEEDWPSDVVEKALNHTISRSQGFAVTSNRPLIPLSQSAAAWWSAYMSAGFSSDTGGETSAGPPGRRRTRRLRRICGGKSGQLGSSPIPASQSVSAWTAARMRSL